MSPSHLALLRGINVGGNNKLPMATLAKIFADAGCDDVRTYIQSGNVVFRASAASAKQLPRVIAKAIHAQVGFHSPVIVRSSAELAAAARQNPFPNAEGVHVAFLADLPAPAAVKTLDPQRSAGDSFAVRGREIYLHLPNGAARTKLTNAYFDSKLSTVSTLRNWNTVLKLIELVGAG